MQTLWVIEEGLRENELRDLDCIQRDLKIPNENIRFFVTKNNLQRYGYGKQLIDCASKNLNDFKNLDILYKNGNWIIWDAMLPAIGAFGIKQYYSVKRIKCNNGYYEPPVLELVDIPQPK